MRSSPVCLERTTDPLPASWPASHGKRLARAALLAMFFMPFLVAAAPPPGTHGKARLAPSTPSQQLAPPTPPAGVLPEPGAMALLASALVLLGRLAHRLDPVGTTV